jgi:hypothetical protein
MRAAVILGLVLTAACTAPRYGDPVARLMDKSESHRVRWAAARQAQEEMFDHPDRIAALKRLVWERGYPADYSNYAVDQLIAIDEAKAKEFLSHAIVLIQDWRTLGHVIDTAVERNWTDFVPALVRSYSMRTPRYRDEERPERAAIEKLLPGASIEQVVVDVFAQNTAADIKQRVAAWALLHRLLEDQGRVRAVLHGLRAQDPLLIDLKAASLELAIVPDSMETVTWLQVLRTEPHQAFWNRAGEVVSRLGDEHKRGLELRHLPVVMWVADTQPGVLEESREELISRLTHWTDAQQHYLKGPTYDGPMDQHPQQFRHWRHQLAWADLVLVHAMSRLMASPRVVRAWFVHADRDLEDKSTEYGGLIRRDEAGEAYVHAYAPLLRRHDLKYVPPKELVTDGYTALAHYHFHAQSYGNAKFAGPGIGDMERIARTQQFNGLVLTFIDKNRLNVDLYFRPDVVIDLGTVVRP